MFITFRSMTPRVALLVCSSWWRPSFPLVGRKAESPVSSHLSVFLDANPLVEGVLCRNASHQSLMSSSACFAGTGWSPWLKEHASVSWYRGSFIRAFPLPNSMPSKAGIANPSLSLHQDPFNSPLTSTWWAISRVHQCLWDKGEGFNWKYFPESNVRGSQFLISHLSPSMCRRVGSNECFVVFLKKLTLSADSAKGYTVRNWQLSWTLAPLHHLLPFLWRRHY